MTAADLFCGWDLGGAHLKLVVVAADGSLAQVEQHPCPLWQGLPRLDTALRRLLDGLPPGRPRHAVTMTGELADVFPDRASGVRQLLRAFVDHAGGGRTLVYAGADGLVSPARAERGPERVASANWRAAADAVARQVDDGLLIDIGSTTTDIVPFSGGRAQAEGNADAERLRSEELVYTGVVRTPVMALADKVPFAGRWQALMAEHFATTADVYRLTGELPASADMMDTADGAGKTVADSARRLARMLGSDLDTASLADWRAVAGYLRESQLQRLNDACARVLSRHAGAGTRFVGAGSGRFLAAALAQRWRRPYLEYGHWLAPGAGPRLSVADCAPAAAVAALARDAALLDKEGSPEPSVRSTG
jgi:probable H4MPT-linked C1 transfer pathway protein